MQLKSKDNKSNLVLFVCRFSNNAKEYWSKNSDIMLLVCICYHCRAVHGNLIAFMTVQKSRLPIDSLEELAASCDYQAGIVYGEATYSLFQVSGIITTQ